jgi:hypothetical protein
VLVFAYLAHNPCVDCGERDPVLLEFDHRDDVEKVSSISDMIRGGHWSWAKVYREIQKCDVRCVGCHRRRTVGQRGSYLWMGVTIEGSGWSPRAVEIGREPAVGLEPTTPALRMRCSTAELRRHCSHCSGENSESHDKSAMTADGRYANCCIYEAYKLSETEGRPITNRVLYR